MGWKRNVQGLNSMGLAWLLLCVCCGCAQVGSSADGESGQSDAPAVSDPEDGGSGGTGLDIPLPEVPDGEEETLDIPLPDPPDEGPLDEETNPSGDWMCDESGEIVEEFSCDWTWTCDTGTYLISCQLAGNVFNCSCKTPSGLPNIFSSQELCTAPNTINVANALCQWKLPVL